MKIDKQLLSYFSVLGFILLLVIISARQVLFVPWTGRTWVSLATDKEKVYIPGGMDLHNELTDSIFIMDLQKKTIKKAGSLPSPRYSTAAVFSDPYVYIIGGYGKEGYLDQVVLFDPEQKTSKVIMHLDEPRAYGTAALFDGVLYYFGGFNGSEVVDTILKIDVDSLSDEITGHLPFAVNFQTGTALGDSYYMLGGENKGGEKVADILEIDPASGEVLRRGNLPVAMIRSGAAFYGEYLYMMGGWGDGGPRKEIVQIDLSSPDRLKAVTFDNLRDKKSDIPLYAWDGGLFMIGGIEERFQRQLDVLFYDPASKSQEKIKLQSYAWWQK